MGSQFPATPYRANTSGGDCLLHCLAIECQMMARACEKTNVHSLEPEDLAALAMAPLARSQHTVGQPDMTRY